MESSPQTIIRPKSMRESPVARPHSRCSLVAPLARNCAEPQDREVFAISFFQWRYFFVNLESAPTKAAGQFAVALGARRGGKAREAIDNPGRAVAVLAAVLTHPGRIVRDPSRVGLRMFVE